jgi:hypothetical protein
MKERTGTMMERAKERMRGSTEAGM